MPKPDLDTLKRLAEAATPGTWYDREDGSGVNNEGGAIFCSAEDAVFIAACNPTAVLALCDYVARRDSPLDPDSPEIADLVYLATNALRAAEAAAFQRAAAVARSYDCEGYENVPQHREGIRAAARGIAAALEREARRLAAPPGSGER